MAGWGEILSDTVGDIVGAWSDVEVSKNQQPAVRPNPDIDNSMLENIASNKMITYVSFGLLALGAIVIINKM